MEQRQGSVEGLVMTPVFWSGKRVFLTGHTGFKGAWLSLWLSRLGALVTGYALEPPTTPSLFEIARVRDTLSGHHIANIRDIGALGVALKAANPDIIIHMAAQPLVRESYVDPVGTYATNLMGTVHVLEAARTLSNVGALLIVTTDKCYENHGWVWGYREADAMGGYDPYSSSKGCAELAVSAYRRSFFRDSRDAPLVGSGRAGNVIGGGDWSKDRLIPDLVCAFLEKRRPLVRSPHAVRPWQHVLEPLSGYLALCEALYERRAGADDGWNFGPLHEDAKPVNWIADVLAAQWGEGAGWELDGTSHPYEATYLYLDIAKAMTHLGYYPRWPLREALARIVTWYKAYARGADMASATLEQIAAFQAAGHPRDKA